MTTKTAAGPVDALLDRLAAFEGGGRPVLSLYLDTRANEHGRDWERFEPFLRKELDYRARSYPGGSADRASIEEDARRLHHWVRHELPPSANGAAAFACAGAGLFERVSLEVPFPESRLFVSTYLHLYPLALVLDSYRRYAAMVADTHLARIYVFGLGRTLDHREVENPKLRRHDMGGWSQMRYQRHVDTHHRLHAKEAADVLARVVRDERVESVFLAGDEVIVPLLRQHLPKETAAKVRDVLRLDIRTPEHEVLKRTLEAFRQHAAETDRERVSRLLDEFRAGGLGVVGLRDTLAALEAGQVDELLVPARPADLAPEEDRQDRDRLTEKFLSLGRETDATVHFVDDPQLLREVGGVGALLRYRLTPDGPAVPPLDPEEEP